ncbi:MAG: HAMP domain-containing sensor histidine kinase, partial [Pseudomonadota bacterium]
MSSLRPDAVLRSRVFQMAIGASGSFIVLALAAVWVWGQATLWSIEGEEVDRLYAMAELAEELYYTDGMDPIIAEITEGEAALWDPDEIYEVLEAGDEILALRDANYDMIAGYPGLHGEAEVGITQLEHEDIDQPVRSLEVAFRGGESVTIGRFVTQREDEVRELLWAGSVFLVAIGLPLGIVTGYLLARGVFRRLHPITATAEAVAAGTLSERAPDTGAGDEFDRLAEGLNRMLDQIEALTQNIESVTVGVAHDLKTPLANIGGRLELIRRDASDADAVADHVDRAEAHLHHLLRIFDALLRLGEIEAGKRREAFQTLDLSSVAEELAESYAPLFEDADKTLIAQICPGAVLTGDRDLL